MLLTNEIKPGVLAVKLNRPEIHNAFNDELIAKITETFKSISDDTRLVVLTGEGRSFCAGADLNWMKSMVNYSEGENIADSEKLYEMFAVIDACPAPVLGLINGHALGGGMGLIAVCDYALTHDKAKFGFTETRLGLIPSVISSFSIRKIGESAARAWFISGEKFNANTAQQMGLISEVTSVDEFTSRSDQLIESFMQAGPQAARSAKKLIRSLKNVKDIKAHTCEQIAKHRVSTEGQEGMNALLEKRSAKWIKS